MRPRHRRLPALAGEGDWNEACVNPRLTIRRRSPEVLDVAAAAWKHATPPTGQYQPLFSE
ncbi:protein of unknown function [Agreia sp. COWG]|nr:protein of unknown function [Agreia sp. COWG]